MTDDGFEAFRVEERLPESFRQTWDEVCRPLAERACDWRSDFGRPVRVGLCGAQGSGKSTVAAAAVRLLTAAGLKAVAVSLDDFYLGKDARAWLAQEVHPLLRVRGPPGTHDVGLAASVLDQLISPSTLSLPAFDKAADEPAPKAAWRVVEGTFDVVILEGWCVGARPEPPERLEIPVNALERASDAQGAWRGYVNQQLSDGYQALFRRLDRLVLLKAPGFEVVRKWRTEQEMKLRERTGMGMSDAEIGRFIAHYERLTRWILEEMPARADWTIQLDEARTPL